MLLYISSAAAQQGGTVTPLRSVGNHKLQVAEFFKPAWQKNGFGKLLYVIKPYDDRRDAICTLET